MKNKTQLDGMPVWFDGKSINEALFCEEFLQTHKIIFTNGAFFTPEGRVTDELPLRGEIFEELKHCAVSNIPRKISNIVELMKLAALAEDFPPEPDRIHLSNGTLFLDGTFAEGKPKIVRNRFPVAYNSNAPKPALWLQFLDGLLYPEDIPTLQEYIGYCLIPSNKGQRMMVITLSDERIEKAIVQNGARLIILDPIQAYMGEKTDMNRANEVRPMFRRLADVAERTGCAVILIGHLNKAAGGQSAYRGLGSIDFRAAARSVLLIGRVKREPNVRVIIHDKSSLAPEGKPIAFCLDPDTGFEWIGEYDITADELLSGAGGNTATKTEQAEKLILDLLADGKELASEDIEKAAAEAGISARTVRAAKKNLDGRIISKRIGAAWYHALKK